MIRIDRFALEHAESKKKYIEFMSIRRAENVQRIPIKTWISNLLSYYGISGNSLTIKNVAERLSANYEFEMSVNNLIRNENFSISKSSSDHVDGQQLCYLCDPSVVFVTNDSDFRNRTRKSSQANRIISFTELLACTNSKRSLLIVKE